MPGDRTRFVLTAIATAAKEKKWFFVKGDPLLAMSPKQVLSQIEDRPEMMFEPFDNLYLEKPAVYLRNLTAAFDKKVKNYKKNLKAGFRVPVKKKECKLSSEEDFLDSRCGG